MKFRAACLLLVVCQHTLAEERVINFSELPQDLLGRPAALRVSVPEAAPQPVPLLIWFGGGQGAPDPSSVPDLVDRTRWAVAVLPYAGNLPRPRDAMHAGRMQGHWDYHRPMLERLRKDFPESFVVIAGMSNGGHVIASYLAQGREELASLGTAFAVIEGSCRESTARRKLPGRPIYLAWGADDGGSMGLMQNIVDVARDAGMALATRTMPLSGHAFPPEEIRRLREWIAAVWRAAGPASGE